ncbi:hypothetical protein PSPO01_05269 [Paraphaeosphaeria sporulosa]
MQDHRAELRQQHGLRTPAPRLRDDVWQAVADGSGRRKRVPLGSDGITMRKEEVGVATAKLDEVTRVKGDTRAQRGREATGDDEGFGLPRGGK